MWLDKGVEHMRHGTARTTKYACPACKQEMKTTRFSLLCVSCGTSAPRVKRHDMNVKELDCVQECSPSYKRNNHLHEWITRVQALERKVVPLEVKQAVLSMFVKWGFDRKAPTHTLVRKFCETQDFSGTLSTCRKSCSGSAGKNEVSFDDTTVRRIKRVFTEIQEPFERHKPPGRKNFLSYSYVLYKVCELLELDDHLHVFPLLKSRANLMKADLVWKGICKDCGYQFIPTT